MNHYIVEIRWKNHPTPHRVCIEAENKKESGKLAFKGMILNNQDIADRLHLGSVDRI